MKYSSNWSRITSSFASRRRFDAASSSAGRAAASGSNPGTSSATAAHTSSHSAAWNSRSRQELNVTTTKRGPRTRRSSHGSARAGPGRRPRAAERSCRPRSRRTGSSDAPTASSPRRSSARRRDRRRMRRPPLRRAPARDTGCRGAATARAQVARESAFRTRWRSRPPRRRWQSLQYVLEASNVVLERDIVDVDVARAPELLLDHIRLELDRPPFVVERLPGDDPAKDHAQVPVPHAVAEEEKVRLLHV